MDLVTLLMALQHLLQPALWQELLASYRRKRLSAAQVAAVVGAVVLFDTLISTGLGLAVALFGSDFAAHVGSAGARVASLTPLWAHGENHHAGRVETIGAWSLFLTGTILIGLALRRGGMAASPRPEGSYQELLGSAIGYSWSWEAVPVFWFAVAEAPGQSLAMIAWWTLGSLLAGLLVWAVLTREAEGVLGTMARGARLAAAALAIYWSGSYLLLLYPLFG